MLFRSATAGTATLGASAPGAVSATQALTVSGAAAVAIRIEPSAATVPLGSTASW